MAADNPENRQASERFRRDSRSGTASTRFRAALGANGGWSEERAEQIASSVLCALDLRLYGDLATIETMPIGVSELLQRCERHRSLDAIDIGQERFQRLLVDELGRNPEEIELILRTTLTTLRETLSEPERDQLERHLPYDLLPFWYLTH